MVPDSSPALSLDDIAPWLPSSQLLNAHSQAQGRATGCRPLATHDERFQKGWNGTGGPLRREGTGAADRFAAVGAAGKKKVVTGR